MRSRGGAAMPVVLVAPLLLGGCATAESFRSFCRYTERADEPREVAAVVGVALVGSDAPAAPRVPGSGDAECQLVVRVRCTDGTLWDARWVAETPSVREAAPGVLPQGKPLVVVVRGEGPDVPLRTIGRPSLTVGADGRLAPLPGPLSERDAVTAWVVELAPPSRGAGAWLVLLHPPPGSEERRRYLRLEPIDGERERFWAPGLVLFGALLPLTLGLDVALSPLEALRYVLDGP